MSFDASGKILEIHNSDLGAFKSCEVYFKEVFVNRRPSRANKYTVYGQTIHSLLDNFYEHFSLNKMIEDFPQLFNTELIKNGVFISIKDRQNFVFESIVMLTNFYNLEKNRDRLRYVKDREIGFKFNYKVINGIDIIFGGRIDKIDSDIVYDYKTNRKKFFIDNNDSQMVIYSLAFKDLYGRMPNAGMFIFLNGGVEYLFPVSNANFDILDNKLARVTEFLKSGREPVPTNDYCYWCGLRDTCRYNVKKPKKVGKLYIKQKAIQDLNSF